MYRDSTFEDDWVMARTLAESESTHGLCALILVGDEEVVKAFMAESLEKPFSMESLAQRAIVMSELEKDLHIRPRKLVQRVKAQTCVFY